MLAVRWICALALLALSSHVSASRVEGITVAHSEPLQQMSLHKRGEVLQQKLRPAEALGLRFNAMGRTFDLELEPNVALIAASSRSLLGDDVGIYRGGLAGKPGSWTRIVIADGKPRGLIWDGREMFAIEAGSDGVLATAQSTIFRLADVTVEAGMLSCGASSPASNGAEFYNNVVRELKVMEQQAPGATEELRIAAIADTSFTDAQGSETAARDAILTRMNNLDGIYSQQLAVQITADLVTPFTAANDPFSAETDAESLLDEVADFRFQNSSHTQRGLTHLLTGKNLDGSTAGIAYVGALCSSRFGAGLAEARRGVTIDSLISAHEIGHNFGASHDGDPMESCPNEPETFIMAPSVSISSNTFSPCSVSVMQVDVAAASCITPLADVDMTISASGQPTSVLLGNAINLTFDFNNLGTQDATGVAATISLPANVTFLAASASQGNCVAAGVDVTCTLGTVLGGSSGTVTVTTTSDSSGPAEFVATVSADTDADPGNNQATVQVNVDAAVDLVANVTLAQQVSVNDSITVVSTLENEASVAATGVAVSVTLDAGIRADMATWDAGTCTVSAQQVDCSATSLPANAQSTLSISVTGVTAGSRGYTITMTANEADTSPANNSASGSVTVSSNTSSGGGAGGGSDDDDGGAGTAGVLLVSLLGLAAVRRRSRRRSES